MFVRKKRKETGCVFESVCVCASERKEREGGMERRRKSCGRGRSGGREGDGDRNEMEGLKDKERGEEREGREGEREIE